MCVFLVGSTEIGWQGDKVAGPEWARTSRKGSKTQKGTEKALVNLRVFESFGDFGGLI